MKKEYVTLKISELKPYPNNPRKNDEAVKRVVESIRQCENIDPIEIDEDNIILSGHTRLKALKQLKYKTVECLRITGLTEEQKKKYRILTNKTQEFAEWDEDLLNLELSDIDLDMDLFGFGAGLDDPDSDDNGGGISDMSDFDEVEDDRDPSCQHNVFENQERAQFPCVGYYGIPVMKPTQTTGDQMLRFMDWKEVQDRENYIAHFYYDDYKFMAAWRDPDKYIELLRQFKAVVSPDFSLYTDFPRALQILSCYRRQWCGAYWQSLGIDVIPDVVWGDKTSFDYCFDGIPEGGTVAVSTVGVKNDPTWNNKIDSLFREGYNEMCRRLCPSTILFYGDMIEGLEGNIIRVPSYYEQKRKVLNEAKKNGKRQ